MIVKDLDDIESHWQMKAIGHKNSTHNKSGLHLKTRKLLSKIYGTLDILEEVRVSVRSQQNLLFDFFIPLLNMAIEVHGEQHFKYNSYFHKTRWNFVKQRDNDNAKRQWCEKNNITLIELLYDETIDEWKEKLE